MKISKVPLDRYHIVSWNDFNSTSRLLGRELLLLPAAGESIARLPRHINSMHDLPIYSNKLILNDELKLDIELGKSQGVARAYCVRQEDPSFRESDRLLSCKLDLMFDDTVIPSKPMHWIYGELMYRTGWCCLFWCDTTDKADYEESPVIVSIKGKPDEFAMYVSDKQYIHEELTVIGRRNIAREGVPSDCVIRGWLD